MKRIRVRVELGVFYKQYDIFVEDHFDEDDINIVAEAKARQVIEVKWEDLGSVKQRKGDRHG